MHNFRHLHLLDLLFTTLCVELSTSILIALSKPGHPHQKHPLRPLVMLHPSIWVSPKGIDTFGGDGRNRTAVQNTFLVASHNHLSIMFINIEIQFI